MLQRPAAASKARQALTAAQAAKRLKCSPATVERLARAGAFRGAKKGRRGWTIPASSVVRVLPLIARRRWVVRRVKPSELTHLVKVSRRGTPFLPTDRPRCRGECRDGPRPCPFVGCKHHLYLDVDAAGSLIINTDREPSQLAESCSLDVAERGGLLDLDDVAELIGVSDQRAAQIEAAGLLKLAAGLGAGMPGGTV